MNIKIQFYIFYRYKNQFGKVHTKINIANRILFLFSNKTNHKLTDNRTSSKYIYASNFIRIFFIHIVSTNGVPLCWIHTVLRSINLHEINSIIFITQLHQYSICGVWSTRNVCLTILWNSFCLFLIALVCIKIGNNL